MKRRGTTLVEMLIAIAIVVVLTAAIAQAFVAGLNYETRATAARDRRIAGDRVEEELADLFRHAYLSTNQADTATYFIASNSGGSIGNTGDSDTVTFTVQGMRFRSSLIASTDDFETLNDTYGPQGGIEEIELSTTAVGDPGDQEGLFLRHQTPADSEPTQGGTERVFDPDIQSISFEFWDGTAWQTTWSTEVGSTKRLPAAVLITYTLRNDTSDQNHEIVVRLPLSDVTADNPAEQTAVGGTQ